MIIPGTKARLSCDRGFQLQGDISNGFIWCRPNGQWWPNVKCTIRGNILMFENCIIVLSHNIESCMGTLYKYDIVLFRFSETFLAFRESSYIFAFYLQWC